MTKILVITAMLTTLVFSNDVVTKECAVALQNSAKIHWKYVEGTITLTEDVNTYNKALQICDKEQIW
jgi:hypothetical protein